MQALVIRQFGDPKTLHPETVPTPRPSGDEVLVQVRATTINPSDVKNVAGLMHGTTLPRIPGRDFAGVVVEGPADLLGKEVWGTGGDISRTRDGSHAQYLLLPRAGIALKPAALAMDAAGVAGLSFVTAWTAIVTTAKVAAGETVVVLGATGGTGSAAVQIAKSRGARVIAVVRSDQDIESVRHDGADEVINSRSANVVETVRSMTSAGPQVVFDGSGMMFAESIEMIALDGRIPVIAAPKDGMATFNLRNLYRKMISVTGIDTLRLNAAACATLLSQMSSGFESGQFKAKAGTPYPLSAAAEAYEAASKGSSRVVLKPNG